MPPDLAWCGQCHAPRTAPVESAPRPVVTAAGPPPQTLARPWIRPEVPDPLPSSRWKAGPTTFGPAGRMVGTAVVVGGFVAMVGLYGWTGPIAPLFVGAAALACTPVLRSLWRKGRIEP